MGAEGYAQGSRSAPVVPSARPTMLLLVACLVYAAWLGTQYIAFRLQYHPRLGAPMYDASQSTVRWWRVVAVACAGFAIVFAVSRARSSRAPAFALLAFGVAICAASVSIGPAYAPYEGIVWATRFERIPPIASITRQGLGVFGVSLAILIPLALRARPRPAWRIPSESHGSAAWGSGTELLLASGLLLGRAERSAGRTHIHRKHVSPAFRFDGEGHVLTVAPTRSGKGVSCVIPNLLDYRGSVLVTDPKGENYAVTARWRRSLGQVVHALDPFDAVGGTASFNPLDLIDAKSIDVADDAALLADMLVVAEGRGSDDHAFWREEARALLGGLILHVGANAPPELRTLARVRELLTLPPHPFQLLLDEMLASHAAGGLVARAAARLLQKADRERSGVVSSAQSHTHFLDSPRMARVMSASTFALADLKRHRVSVYLVLPPERMGTYQRWLRLMIASSLLAMTRTRNGSGERVLFLLDEFAHLGRMQPVERDIGLVGGYGATFWLLVQDLAQLKGTYPEKWQTFLANCAVFQAFGTNDWDTADYLSKRTGDATIVVSSENRSAGVSRGAHGNRQEGAAVTMSERGRRLVTPDEVLRLPADEQLLFVRGMAPVRARKLDYLREREFVGRADANPMHAGDGSTELCEAGRRVRA